MFTIDHTVSGFIFMIVSIFVLRKMLENSMVAKYEGMCDNF